MTVIISNAIKDNSPLPDEVGNSDTASMQVYVDEAGSNRTHLSEVGKRRLGLLDVADASCDLTPDLDPVYSGGIQVPVKQIITGWNGTAAKAFQDVTQLAEEIANGTTTQVEDNYGETAVEATVDASQGDLKHIAVDDASVFASHIGKAIIVPTAAGTKPMRNFIKSIDVSVTPQKINVVYPMDELPFATGKVKLLIGFTHDMGGNISKVNEITMKRDFGGGTVYRTIIHRARSTQGLKQTTAKGKIKTSMSFAIEGHSKVSGGQAQVIPITRHGIYGKATTT